MAKTPNRMKDADEFSTFTNGQFIRKKADGTGLESATAGGSLTIEEEGVSQGTATTLNFVGATVTAAVAAGEATITVAAAPASHEHSAADLTSGTLNTARIAANALNFDKIEQVVEARILGRRAGQGTGNIEELTNADVNNITQAVTGPASAVPGNVPSFSGATGKAVDDSGVSIASVNTAINHAAMTTGNPHQIALGDLYDGSFAELQEKLTDFQILLSTNAGEINALTLKAAPTASDMVLIEDAAAGFARKKAAFPTAASEANNLETVCTGILVDEVPVGSATDDVTYKPLVSGVLKYATGGAFSAAGIGDLMTAGSGVSFTGSTLNVGAGTGVTVGTDDISVNYGTTSTTACVGNDARLKAAPKAVTVETPVSGNVILMGRADRTLTIANVHGVIDSGTSVVVSLDSGASRATSDQQHVNAQTVSSTTTGNDLTKTANLTFDAGDWIWLTIGTVTGIVGSICITVSFT